MLTAWRPFHALLLLLFGLEVDFDSYGQDDGIGPLVLSVAGGSALPIGSFTGTLDESNSASTHVLGGARPGFSLSATASFWFLPKLGVVAMTNIEGGRGTASIGGSPWICQPCGHGYIAPEHVTSNSGAGDWNSSAVMVGLVYTVRNKDPFIVARAMIGTQRLLWPAATYSEQGEQLILTPIYSRGTFTRSIEQQAMTATSSANTLGVEVLHRFGGRISVTGSLDALFGGTKFEGKQVTRFDGATQSNPDYHSYREEELKLNVGSTRVLVQVGLALELVRRSEPIPTL